MAEKYDVKLSFTETMSGYIKPGTKSPDKGAKRGKKNNNEATLNAMISIANVNNFIENEEHAAKLEGTVDLPSFGSNLSMENGVFNLFITDDIKDEKEMVYRFNFTADDGKRYFFDGKKDIEKKMFDFLDPLDPVKDMTTLFTTIHEGDSDKGNIVAAGILRFHLLDLPALVGSIDTEGENKALQRKATFDFFRFVLGELADTYLPLLFQKDMEMKDEYDAVVIGSGFGGGATAYKLAEAGKTVCLLERGKAWRGKTNIKKLRDFAGKFRTTFNNGLFDYRIYKKMQVLQANGVGGGSLIYANVILRPDADTFDEDWPAEINMTELEKYYPSVEKMLDVRKAEPPKELDNFFPKTVALQEGAKATPEGEWKSVNIAVQPFDQKKFGNCKALEGNPTDCRACGKCVLVCNRSAKNTVDLNYIKDAIDYGAHLFAEHEVTRVVPINDDNGKSGYEIHIDNLKHKTTKTIKAKKVIMAAGTLGSTEFLLKSQEKGDLKNLSATLGDNFSGNGDFLMFTTDSDLKTKPTWGPTITSLIDYQKTQPANQKFIVEEGGIPSPIAPIVNILLPYLNEVNSIPAIKDLIDGFLNSKKKNFVEFITKLGVLLGTEIKDDIEEFIDAFRKKPIDYAQIYLAMGRDASDGKMLLDTSGKFDIDWNPDASLPLFNDMEEKLTKVSKGIGGEFQPFPFWSIFKTLVTVHPLGGCKMGTAPDNGVVDANGKVFNYENLYVSDGAIFPKALGVNPALTIAALAERNADMMLKSWD